MSANVHNPGELRRIVLTGFMGSGKTTVGRLLARRLGWEFADLDHAVAAHTGRTVPQIFAEQGEAAFRLAEVEALRLLLQQDHSVIALGGGAPGTPAIRDLLSAADRTAVVYLEAPFAVLYARCRVQAEDASATARPLLGSEEAAMARFRQREPLYAAVASYRVPAGLPSPKAVAEAVLAALRVEVPSLQT